MTAEQIGTRFGIAPRNHSGLVEYAIGEFETTHYDELVDKLRFFERIEADLNYAPAGGESVVGVARRMLDTINEFKAQHKGQTLAVVSHGAAIGVTLSQLLHDKPFPFHDYHMNNTAISKLLLTESGVDLEFFNRFDHL